MEKELRLIKKVTRLLRRIGSPRWLHHFGPKKYEFKQHLAALLMRAFCRLSYRRVVKLFSFFGNKCPRKSALQYTAKKISSNFWQKLLKATCGDSFFVAIDSTGFSRTNPSYHYLRRIDGKLPKIPVKLSLAFDTLKKKFCSAKIRVLPAHDVKDAKFLLKNSNPKIAVADKGYDSEKLYKFAYEENFLFLAPKRRTTKKGFYRRMMHKKFSLETYHRRELVESANSAIKRMFGASVSSKLVRTIRTEVYCRLVCYNILSVLVRLFGLSLY